MYKIWKLKESKSNKLILIKDKVIYKGNPKDNDLNRINSESSDLTFLKDLFSIPYSYIRRIENQNGKKSIKIFFGKDSEEELHIDNEKIKNELFEYIKIDNQNLKYSSQIPSDFEYAKGQFFALLSMTGIFFWSEILAFQIENGTRYELVGGGSPGITGIVLAIANLGSINILIGYVIILSIIIFSLTKKLKTKSKTECLTR
jgi:hypothetical protein|nr:hypothetical protein [uncultured Flavobacterium sp.]